MRRVSGSMTKSPRTSQSRCSQRDETRWTHDDGRLNPRADHPPLRSRVEDEAKDKQDRHFVGNDVKDIVPDDYE
jgi:hypothetical protein